ncbi:Hypothetical protein R9X50_00511300 [Acrodontium crateriforme]|uniref:Uncharacterized protein n=1 Tax=Acrodontium crateriforme TaxID=150365 RepID=A0AAQ3M7A7_9PEZI|nr:Hypothetical protein R9X50_00511300 [Acrodontium crateriforme]
MPINYDLDQLRVGLSLNQVASLISGGVSILHTLFPVLIAAILVALISAKSFNAATWSALGREVQKSALPTILMCDGGISFNLKPSVFLMCCLSIFYAALLPTAGFLTPIPLTEEIRPASHTTDVDFRYIRDTTFFGQGTPDRPNVAITRVCDHAALYGDCPNTVYNDSTIRLQYPGHVVVNTSIPELTTAPYETTSMAATVAKPLDIQFRNFYEGHWIYLNNNESRLVGGGRPLTSFVLQDGFQLVEGLIIDTTDGGVGIRNHTIPIGHPLGTEWEEDILWIKPVTACTATNLTLGFSVSQNHFTDTDDGYLSSSDGFAVLNEDPPTPRWDSDDNQNNWRVISPVPDLQDRANNAAWWNNLFVAKQLGINSSEVGRKYTAQSQGYAQVASPNSIIITAMDGLFLDNNRYATSLSNGRNFSAYSARCAGYDDLDPSTPEKAFVRCGYLYSVPEAVDNPTRQLNLNSEWSQQLYTCASSVKASIKVVSFRSNGTEALGAITVLNVESKKYDGTSLPRWAVEKAWGYSISDINLFWGLTNANFDNSSTLQVTESEELYLPAMNHYDVFGNLRDDFAAGTAFGAVWNSVYQSAAAVRGTALAFVPSYSGETNYAQTLKWYKKSRTAEGSANILNLIWTDLVASTIVGTVNGYDTQGQDGLVARSESSVIGQRTVSLLMHNVGYSDWRYALPAVALLLLFVLLVVTALVFCCVGRASTGRMKHYINQTSIGRAIAQVQHPDAAPIHATSKQWKKTAGKTKIDIPAPLRKNGKLSPAREALVPLHYANENGVRPDAHSQPSAESIELANQGGGASYSPIDYHDEDDRRAPFYNPDHASSPTSDQHRRLMR